ncbi:FAD:protein FMN transferase [Bradyrhizobium canariense]|uniref:FAD:protein FMN transferase n=1 Tax=Bradyrhizobium canariense TaxID=255045 RepID=A0A1H2BGC6_9BRAD|nr:FAD:protein FMN transferase [Bradyrhizobium canariense]SDT57194.1 thiamine biosynthesis lipoprotein [Bradyrhizobium canariense]
MNKWMPNRRRFIQIVAAASGIAFLPQTLRAGSEAAADLDRNIHIWRGVALGADAEIQLHHPDAAVAKRLIALSLAEAARLERIFSLYDVNSSLSRLNRSGELDSPPLELVELLGLSANFSRMTGGSFDVTVQPLWQLYAAHFSNPDADPAGPSPEAIKRTIERVGCQSIMIDEDAIRYSRRGMAVTLNGIAQGYLTDRVVDLLHRNGVEHSLVDMGEIRAIGNRPFGGAWRVGLEDPSSLGQVAEQISLDNQAVSTSGGYGTVLDPAGRFNHIFDPGSGGTSWRYRSVSVVAATATTADALSTAFSLMPIESVKPIVRELALNAYFVLPDGRREVLDAAS